jgi:hypothetical protein
MGGGDAVAPGAKGPAGGAVISDAAKPPMPEGQATPEAGSENANPADAGVGMGMMGGMGGFGGGGRRGPGKPGPAPVKYEPTAWGRYAKVLLSSSEFIFIN